MPEELKQKDDQDAQDATNESEEQSTEDKSTDGSTPPWGSDEDFDPARAWNLIQNLRSDKEGLQQKLDSEVPSKENEISTLNSTITEKSEKIAEHETTISSLEREKGELNAVITKQNLLAASGLPLKLVKNVVGNNEDEWAESVETLKELRGTSGSQSAPDPVQVAQQNGASSAPDEDAEARKFFGIK